MHASIRPRWPFRQWAPSICSVGRSVGEEEINCLACCTTLVFVDDDDDRKPSSRNFIRRHQLVCHKIRRGRRRGKGYTIYCAAPGWMVGWMGGWTWPPFVKPRSRVEGEDGGGAVVATWQWQAVRPTDSASVRRFGKAARRRPTSSQGISHRGGPPSRRSRQTRRPRWRRRTDGEIKPGN